MREIRDHFSKVVLGEILEPAGQVHMEQRIPTPDAKRLDVWFVPHLRRMRGCPRYLRLPYRMGRRACGFEPCSRTPGIEHVEDIQCKQLAWQRVRRREARRKKRPVPSLHPTWIITPGRPRQVFARWGVKPARGYPPGFHCAEPELWFVVVSELPKTPETVLLRLLGSPKLQQEAMAELGDWPADDGEAAGVATLLGALSEALEHGKKEVQENAKLMTAARKAAEKKIKDAVASGRQEGRQEGRQQAMAQSLLQIYKERLGRVPARVRAGVLAVADDARLQALIPLFVRGDARQIESALLG